MTNRIRTCAVILTAVMASSVLWAKDDLLDDLLKGEEDTGVLPKILPTPKKRKKPEAVKTSRTSGSRPKSGKPSVPKEWTAEMELRTQFAQLEHEIAQFRAEAGQTKRFGQALAACGVTVGKWRYIGPFENEDGVGHGTAYPPEEGVDLSARHEGKGGELLQWLDGSHFVDGERCDLAMFDENQWRTVYLYREITSARAQSVKVSVGCTDDLKIFLNGKCILEAEGSRKFSLGEWSPALSLKAGRNALLVKVGNGKDDCCEFALDDRKPSEAQSSGRWQKVYSQAYHPASTILLGDKTPLDVVLRRTSTLMADLNGSDGAVDLAALRPALADIRKRAASVDSEDEDALYELYVEACKLRRRVVFANPLLNFGKMLAVKRHFARKSHMCDQYFGFHARSGGELLLLSNPFARNGSGPTATNVLAGSTVEQGRLAGRRLEGGSFLSPDLSYDGKTIVFAYAECEGSGWSTNSSYHIFKVNVDGSGLVQLTDGKWNDFDPCFLPNGRICFISERRGGFGRCHGRPVPTYTLYSMNPDGSDVTPLSYHETNEWHPSVNNDGMIVYSRWDYVDRDSDIAHHPWVTSPDGRDARAIHGNFPVPPNGRSHRPWMELDVKPIPGSTRYISTAAPHHGQSYGSFVLIDPNVEDDGIMSQLKRVTPDTLFPEAEGSRGLWVYATAWPLSEKYYLCAHRPQNTGGRNGATFGIYVLDAFGNRELLYRDTGLQTQSPMPLGPRERPAVIPCLSAAHRPPGAKAAAPGSVPASGTVACMNVYDSLKPWPDGTSIEAIRIIQLFPKATASSGHPRVSAAAQSLCRGILGTVPVEADGSCHFEAPAGKAFYFQALDGDGKAVQSMRSLTYLQPGQRLVCQGCHEPRHRSPALPRQIPLALRREPSRIKPEVDGANPVLFPRLVQPVLDRNCVACHSRNEHAPSLASDLGGRGSWTASYAALAPRFGFYFNGGNGAIRHPLHGGSRTTPGKFGARAAAFAKILSGDHTITRSTAPKRRSKPVSSKGVSPAAAARVPKAKPKPKRPSLDILDGDEDADGLGSELDRMLKLPKEPRKREPRTPAPVRKTEPVIPELEPAPKPKTVTVRHPKVELPRDDLHRLVLWLDSNCNFFGAYHELEKQARGEVVRPSIE